MHLSCSSFVSVKESTCVDECERRARSERTACGGAEPEGAGCSGGSTTAAVVSETVHSHTVSALS